MKTLTGNWEGKGSEGGPVQTAVVSWVLSASKGGTNVTVKHSGLAKMSVARKDLRGRLDWCTWPAEEVPREGKHSLKRYHVSQ